MPQKFAIVVPVTNPTAEVAGSLSKSSNQLPATFSVCAAMGEDILNAAFWSHVVASQLAANAAGNVPPNTNPK
jgi:hypothetical protein